MGDQKYSLYTIKTLSLETWKPKTVFEKERKLNVEECYAGPVMLAVTD